MKVFAVSDLHLSGLVEKPMNVFGEGWEGHLDKIKADWREKVTKEDIVLLGGDTSWGMKLEEGMYDVASLSDLPGKKVFIRGNHDYWWNGISKIRAALPAGSYCIQNDAMRFGSVVICGTRGWTVPEIGTSLSADDEKILKREALRMEMSLKCAEKLRTDGDMLIAMCHFPPFDSRYSPSVFTELFNRYSVDKVVYGHLHGSRSRAELYVKRGDIEYYLTSCDKLGNSLATIADIGISGGAPEKR